MLVSGLEETSTVDFDFDFDFDCDCDGDSDCAFLVGLASERA